MTKAEDPQGLDEIKSDRSNFKVNKLFLMNEIGLIDNVARDFYRETKTRTELILPQIAGLKRHENTENKCGKRKNVACKGSSGF